MELNNVKKGAIILSASGMCDAGRIKHHLKHNLWRPECTILFVGYQAPGTKGARLSEGVSSIRIHGEEIKVKADIENIDGYSSHADQEGLLKWLSNINKSLQNIFLVHGSEEALDIMKDLIPERLNLNTYAPSWKETVTLTGEIEVSVADIMEAYAELGEKLQKYVNEIEDTSVNNRVLKYLNEIERLLKEKAGY